MDAKTRKRLEDGGWVVGDAQSFLGLSDAEMAYIGLRIAISGALRERRIAAGLTQQEIAERIGSSQSRVAKMESGYTSVSLDLLVRALLATGATLLDVATAIAPDLRSQVA